MPILLDVDAPPPTEPARADELADPHSDDPAERVAHAFFSEPAAAEDWFDAPAPPMPAGARRAMIATIIMLIASAALIGGYTVYARVIMPVPVELGQPHAWQPPEPLPAVTDDTAAAPAAAAPGARATSSPPPSAHGLAHGLTAEGALMLAEADALRLRGDATRALAAYQRLLALSPEQPQALTGIAALRLERGDATMARRYAERATRADPSNARAWAVLGATRAVLRDAIGAREAYQQCLAHAEAKTAVQCRPPSR